MAEIYLGVQAGEDGFRRLCAIKRILPHYANDKEFIEMFRDEAHICKRLQHANIVRVEGFEEVEGSYAIIMEFVDGSDLRSMLSTCEKANTRLAVPMACFIAAEAARGLHYAHTKQDEITGQALRIVHRDISPQNILLSYEGEVKITDFGIADAGNKNTETKPGVVKGKYSYMSPEQISAKEVDARTDVFALGIVLWEALAMRRLFHGEHEVDTIQLVKNCEIPQPLSQFNQGVDPDLEAIVMKALARDPKDRYETAEMFEKDLRQYINARHTSFTSSELSTFLKQLLAKRRDESQGEIKRILTSTNQRPMAKLAGSSSVNNVIEAAKDDLKVGVSSRIGRTPTRSGMGGGMPSSLGPKSLNSGSRIGAGGGGGQFTNNPGVYIRDQRRRAFYIPLVVALILIVGGAITLVRTSLTAKEPMQLVLRTTPSQVRIELDGAALFDGKYKRTPIGLKMPAGRHSMTITRKNYAPVRLEIEGQGGETVKKEDLVLVSKTQFAAIRIQFVGYGSKEPYFEVNSGYITGRGASPLEDLPVGQPHIVTIMPDYPEGRDAFSCRFKAKSRNWRDPLMITVNVKSRSCSLSGGTP